MVGPEVVDKTKIEELLFGGKGWLKNLNNLG